MALLPDNEAHCTGCFLYEERGGRVCPMLDRQAEEAADAERQADDRLHALVVADVPDAPSLIELVRAEVQGRPASAPLALPPAPVASVYAERKETHVVRVDPIQ